MLQRLRESLTILLLGMLPFHALLVTVGTKILAGPDHAPLAALALWKEAVLGIILTMALVEIIIYSRQRSPFTFDTIDILIAVLLILSCAVSFFTHRSLPLFLLGFKYDFIPLIAFSILRRAAWSDAFWTRAGRTLLLIGTIIASYGLLTFFLPSSFFRFLGYSDLHSLYVPDGPIAAYQQIGGATLRRVQSTMSGPNQLGLWLLIPWSIAIGNFRWKFINVIPSVLIALVLVLTFSRAAWIGAAVIVFGALWMKRPRRKFSVFSFQFSAAVVVLAIVASLVAPNIVFRVASTRDHFTRPLQAISVMAEHPFGLGLGTAGPASNRVSDACVFLEEGADVSWAKDRPNLCVFIGETQVQPSDRDCRCPLLPENWYLQIGVELGVLGFLLYIALIIALVIALSNAQIPNPNAQSNPKSPASAEATAGRQIPNPVLLVFLALSIAALFLHAWEDAAVAFTLWMGIASATPLRPLQKLPPFFR